MPDVMRSSLQSTSASIDQIPMVRTSFWPLTAHLVAVAQDMEDAAAKVRRQLEAAAAEKREAAAALSAADRDVILWDQRLQLEREMQVRLACLCGDLHQHTMRCTCTMDPSITLHAASDDPLSTASPRPSPRACGS